MFDPADYPFLILLGSLAAFCLSSTVGCWLGKRTEQLEERNREDFKFVLGGTLTLLGLIVGFTFSMAVERYNQRKNYEEEEANAIGTEYLRVDVVALPEDSRMRALLRDYLDQRIVYYTSNDATLLR